MALRLLILSMLCTYCLAQDLTSALKSFRAGNYQETIEEVKKANPAATSVEDFSTESLLLISKSFEKLRNFEAAIKFQNYIIDKNFEKEHFYVKQYINNQRKLEKVPVLKVEQLKTYYGLIGTYIKIHRGNHLAQLRTIIMKYVELLIYQEYKIHDAKRIKRYFLTKAYLNEPKELAPPPPSPQEDISDEEIDDEGEDEGDDEEDDDFYEDDEEGDDEFAEEEVSLPFELKFFVMSSYITWQNKLNLVATDGSEEVEIYSTAEGTMLSAGINYSNNFFEIKSALGYAAASSILGETDSAFNYSQSNVSEALIMLNNSFLYKTEGTVSIGFSIPIVISFGDFTEPDGYEFETMSHFSYGTLLHLSWKVSKLFMDIDVGKVSAFKSTMLKIGVGYLF